MDDRITELESIALESRTKKGRMDAASREKASALLASILADSAVDPVPALNLLEDIKAEAIAEALRSCWPKMETARQNLFRKWLPSPTTDRSYRRLAFLVASVIEKDGPTALDWLGRLIPPGRKSLGREARETLAATLFGERLLSFDALLAERANPTELVRISAALFDIAADPSLSVSAMTRARLASAIFGYLTSADPLADDYLVSDLKSKMVADAKRWPAALRERFIPVGQEEYSVPLTSATVEVVATAESRSTAIPESNQSHPTPPIVELGPLQEELPRLEGELSNRISAITREVDLLRRAHECILKLVETAERVEAQRETARRELERVQGSLRLAEGELDRAKADSARAVQRESEQSVALEQMKSDAEGERRRLAQQISANASGRIEEFKKRLGLNLSRLVIDLPGRDTPVNAELGKILLLQFHQFLDALRQEGIETLSTKVAS